MGFFRCSQFYAYRGGNGLRVRSFQYFTDIANAGYGKAVGCFRAFALSNQIVKAIQSILQDLLLDIVGVRCAGKEKIYVTN
jgi:hypothetical protein